MTSTSSESALPTPECAMVIVYLLDLLLIALANHVTPSHAYLIGWATLIDVRHDQTLRFSDSKVASHL
jgi:hypothetical protein